MNNYKNIKEFKEAVLLEVIEQRIESGEEIKEIDRALQKIKHNQIQDKIKDKQIASYIKQKENNAICFVIIIALFFLFWIGLVGYVILNN